MAAAERRKGLGFLEAEGKGSGGFYRGRGVCCGGMAVGEREVTTRSLGERAVAAVRTGKKSETVPGQVGRFRRGLGREGKESERKRGVGCG